MNLRLDKPLAARGEPSTWFPREGHVETERTNVVRRSDRHPEQAPQSITNTSAPMDSQTRTDAHQWQPTGQRNALKHCMNKTQASDNIPKQYRKKICDKEIAGAVAKSERCGVQSP